MGPGGTEARGGDVYIRFSELIYDFNLGGVEDPRGQVVVPGKGGGGLGFEEFVIF